MIHMGRDHKCVMTIFTISMPGKNSNHKDMKGKHDMVKRERSTQTAKSISIEMPELEKIPRNRRNNLKKTPPQKKMKHMTHRKDAKAQVKRENAAAAKANRTLEEAEAQEIERISMKRSSTVANTMGCSSSE